MKQPAPLTPFERIEAARGRAGLSQTALCRKAGLAPNTLAQAKSTGGALRLETLTALARALGRPLAELLGEAPPAAVSVSAAGGSPLVMRSYLQLRPSKLNPRIIDLGDAEQMAALQGLADTIERHGVVEPLVIRPDGEIVAGERRWRAIGLLVNAGTWGEDDPRIPCVERPVGDQEHLELALIENGQRLDVPPLQEAEGYVRLQKLDPRKWTTAAIAAAVGKTQRHVQLRLALLTRLHPEAQALLKAGTISLAQARALTLGPKENQKDLIGHIKSGTGWYQQPEHIRECLLRDMVPVKRAIFKVEESGLETFTDEDTGAVYFTDEKAFKAKQKAAARKLVKDLEPDFKSVAFVEGYFSTYDYVKADKDTIAKGKALAFVVMSHDGTVTIKKNLVKKGSAKASSAAEDRQRKAEEAALMDMESAIAGRLREKPENALRFYLLNLVTGHDDDLPRLDHYDLELSDARLRGGLKPLGKLLAKGGGASAAGGVAAWRALAGIDLATALEAFADAVSRAIVVTEFTAATWDFAAALDVALAAEHAALWRRKLAGEQRDLETAIAEKKAAE